MQSCILHLEEVYEGCRRQMNAVEESISTLRVEEGKQQAAVDALQISTEDESSLKDLQVWSAFTVPLSQECHSSHRYALDDWGIP